jgi:uncharacterized protein
MRFGTAQQLRRRGFDEADVAELNELRAAVEDYLRGNADRAVRSWWSTGTPTWIGSRWVTSLAACPISPALGATWTSIRCRFRAGVVPGAAVLRRQRRVDADRRQHRRLASSHHRHGRGADRCAARGCDHVPTLNDGHGMADISPQYTSTLRSWIGAHVATQRARQEPLGEAE